MSEEFFGSAAFAKTEIDVKQPPPARGPMSMKGIRKEANKQFKAHKGRMKEGRARIKALNGQIRAARFGGRLGAEQKRAIRADVRALRTSARAARRDHGLRQELRQWNLKAARAHTRDAKSRARASRKAIRQMKRAQNPRFHARQQRREQRASGKAFNLAWAMRLLKKAFAKRKGDARNHGFSGSGKGGRTGRAGFSGKKARRIRGGV